MIYFNVPNLYQYIENYDSGGALSSQVLDYSASDYSRWEIYASGSVNEHRYYVDAANRLKFDIIGLVGNQSVTDWNPERSQPWQYRMEHTTNGVVDRRITTFDSGTEANTWREENFYADRSVISQFSNGNPITGAAGAQLRFREARYLSDGHKVSEDYNLGSGNWSSVVTLTDGAGRLDYRRTDYRNGDYRERDYDLLQQSVWNSREYFYIRDPSNPNAHKLSMRIDYQTNYTEVIDFDPLNVRSYDTQRNVYNQVGRLVERYTNGSNISEVNGESTSVISSTYSSYAPWASGNNAIVSYNSDVGANSSLGSPWSALSYTDAIGSVAPYTGGFGTSIQYGIVW